MENNASDSWLSKLNPRTALIVARVMAGAILFFVLYWLIVALPGMFAAAYHRGFHFATFGAFLFGFILLALICAVPAFAAFGLWRGRRWGWWLQFALMIVAIVRYPHAASLAVIFVVALVLIRDPYFRLQQTS